MLQRVYQITSSPEAEPQLFNTSGATTALSSTTAVESDMMTMMSQDNTQMREKDFALLGPNMAIDDFDYTWLRC